MSEEGQWRHYRERGSEWFFDACVYAYRFLGWRLARWLMYPVVTFFYLTAPRRYKNSQEYFKHLVATGGEDLIGGSVDWRDSYRQNIEFGTALFDRVSLWLGNEERYEITFPNRELFLNYIEENQGAILLSFHVGHFDVMRYFALSKGVVVNIVAYWNNTESVNRLLEKIDSTSQVNLIEINSENPQGMIELKERVDNGEYIAVLGDRISAGAEERYRNIPFLGEEAPFPEGPFLMGHLLECSILLTYCVRTGPRKYEVNMEIFADTINLSRPNRDERLGQYLRKYVGKLEDVCKKYPYQWFNFHSFWSEYNGRQD